MPADPSTEQVRDHSGDPLAAFLRTDEIERPRSGFKDDLRAELVSRPPVVNTPPTAALGRPLLLAVAVVALLVVLGLLRLGPLSIGPFGTSAVVTPEAGAGTVVEDSVAPIATTDQDNPADPQHQSVPAAARTGTTASAESDPAASDRSAASASETEPTSATTAERTVVPLWTPTVPVVAPAFGDSPTERPAGRPTDRPSSGATATEDDVPDYTPGPRQPTDTPVPPTPTDSGYPALPAAPTAAPTNPGLPTSIAP